MMRTTSNARRGGLGCPALVFAAGLAAAGVAASMHMTNTVSPVEAQLAALSHPIEAEGLVATCFAEGTSDEVMQAVNDALMRHWEESQEENGWQYFTTGRWPGSQGDPFTVLWSFVPDGLSIPSGVGEGTAPSDLFADMDLAFASQGGRATWVNRFVQIFARWEELTGMNYTRVTFGGNDWDDGASWSSSGAAGLRGDIRIAGKTIDGVNGILAYNFFPSTGTGGNMVIDTADGNNWRNTTNQNRFLRNTLGHENGHGIGILHVCPTNQTKLMEPFLSTAFEHARHDDIRAAQRHYGDPFEPDNTAGTAFNLGTINIGQTLTQGTLPPPLTGTNPTNTGRCSIDANGEQDYTRFTVNQASNVTITVRPQGFTYANYSENTCNSGSTVDSLRQADLAVQLIGTDGVTVIATASGQPTGNNEVITDACLPAAGNYFVRVFESDTPTQSQLYTLDITVNAASGGCGGGGCPSDWNGDGRVDSDDFFDFLNDYNGGNGDFNGDGRTDSDDFFDFLNAYNSGC